jgi:hypothetical protein
MQDGIAERKTVVDTGNNKQPQERSPARQEATGPATDLPLS